MPRNNPKHAADHGVAWLARTAANRWRVFLIVLAITVMGWRARSETPMVGFMVEGKISVEFKLSDGRGVGGFDRVFEYSSHGNDYSIQLTSGETNDLELEVYANNTCVYLSEGAKMVGGVSSNGSSAHVSPIPSVAVVASSPVFLTRNCMSRVIWLTFGLHQLDPARIAQRFSLIRCGVLLDNETQGAVAIANSGGEIGPSDEMIFVDSKGANRQLGVSIDALGREAKILGHLRITSRTNFLGVSIPTMTEFFVFWPRSNSAPSVASEHYRVQVTKVAERNTEINLPPVNTKIDVTDTRFSSEKLRKVIPIFYALTNGSWLARDEPSLDKLFQAFEMAESKAIRLRTVEADRRWVRFFVRGILLVLVVFGALLLLRVFLRKSLN